MKKKRIIIIIISVICLIAIVIASVNSYIQFALTFSEGKYHVYVPAGVPDEIHLSNDVFFVTSRMSFDYANELLLNDDYKQFETVFVECYDKFSHYNNVYLSIRRIFLDEKNKYSEEQQDVLIACVEKIYRNDVLKPNVFLANKNLLLQIELNREFGNIKKAFSLLEQAEAMGVA